MFDTETNIQFFDFIEKYYPKLKRLKTLTNEKFIKLDGNIIVASHPHAENIKFNHRNNLIAASPFKVPTQDPKINKIIEQNNYTNESLIMIGKQLDEIDIKINNSKCLENNKKEQSLVKFQDIAKVPVLKSSASKLKQINEMLESIKIADTKLGPSTSIQTLNNTFDGNTYDNSDKQPAPKLHRIKGKNHKFKIFYNQPIPNFVETPYKPQFSVSADKFYTQNIDGLKEQEILDKLQHMTMVANGYLQIHNYSQPEIVDLLALGFTGTLHNWQTKHLTEASKDHIRYVLKISEDNETYQ